ncbi:hypothetical protein ACFW9D_14685 [Streptomyces sp. NPDC059524]|uniref:hypothetical protein n=1 Tax=Streptomyces sp. NPDC059524 TaxID=3346856 RepID=UPI00368273B6
MAAASVAAVCLGGTAAFTLGGDAPRAGYVAVGAAGGPAGASVRGTAPRGKVELVPLDPPGPSGAARDADGSAGSASGGGSGGSGDGGPAAPGAPDGGGAAGGEGSASPGAHTPGAGGTGSGSGSGSGSGTGTGSGTGSGTGTSPGAPGTPTPDPSDEPSTGGPALLKLVGDPELDDTDRRWCQDVTLTLLNSGGSAVRSGTVTFETHIIGALGVDWATIENTEKLPVPIEAGEKKEKTWKVCVDSWRVPLGMHLETRDVTVDAG